MTWSTWDTRRRIRVAATAAGLVGALALTACSGDSGSDDEPSTGSGTSASTSASAGADAGGGSRSGDSKGTSGGIQGSWLATTDGKAVALVITGDQAALFTTGGSVCSGTAGQASGARTIRLTCTDGNKDRASGVAEPVGGETLKVTWKSGLGVEEYTRSEGGTLPTGLPTASLGS
ncbi:hypothetical protein OG604_25900 [Streptomyces sp. NBC_01231]|nr:hypothetical protein OG604_25900 [Streptomyces sp. NBC_01231]